MVLLVLVVVLLVLVFVFLVLLVVVVGSLFFVGSLLVVRSEQITPSPLRLLLHKGRIIALFPARQKEGNGLRDAFADHDMRICRSLHQGLKAFVTDLARLSSRCRRSNQGEIIKESNQAKIGKNQKEN